MRKDTVLLVLLALVAAPSALLAQAESTRMGRAVTASAAPVVDGRLDEAVWQSAPALGDFVQRVPEDGAPASLRTEVRVLYDDDALYFGVWLFDHEPSSIVHGEGIRDYDLAQSDAVLLILDTFKDQQNAFVFGTNPAGIEYDGQIANEGQGGGRFMGGGGQVGNRRQQSGSGGGFNLNWDASWAVATSIGTDAWYAEFRIPFSTLRYAGGEGQTWGFNAARRIRRLNEQSFWSPIPRQFDEYRLTYSGALEGMNPPAQRMAQVTPYLLQKAQRDYVLDTEARYPGDVGGDAKVQITPSLTLDLTLNTDFAQVEVDDAQTNLTRFSISFPEKRPFFLENAGQFNVGGGGADLFFSRRIGLREGQSVPIVGGGRLSGKAAGLNVGLLHIRTDDVAGVSAAQDYSVMRLARELPNRSRVGAAFLRRGSAVDGDWNNTMAVDGQLGLGEAWTFSSFLARTETPGLEGDDHIADFQAGYTSRDLRVNLSLREVGEDFNPELGFLPRNNHRYGQIHAMTYVRPGKWNLRELRPHASFFTYRTLGTGFEETSRLHIDNHFEWESGMEFHPAVNWSREGLLEPFEISPGVVVPAGTYDGWELGWVFITNESAPLSFNGGLNKGNLLSGSRTNPYGTLTYRVGSSFSAGVRLDYNDVSLPQGDFSVTLAGLRLAYFFTPRIYLQSLTQYSDQADSWSSNVRFGWLNDAGTGLFIVYNQSNGFDTLSRDTPLARGLTLKYTKLFDVARW
jgi:hypothetical protein